MIEARRPPTLETGAPAWLRRNLFNSPLSSVATVLIAAAVVFVLYELLSWVIFAANWQQLWNNLKLFAVYRYPADLLSRPLSVTAMFMTLLGVTAGASQGGTGRIVRGVFFQFLILVAVLTVLGLLYWEAVRWGWLAVGVSALVGFGFGRFNPRVLPG